MGGFFIVTWLFTRGFFHRHRGATRPDRWSPVLQRASMWRMPGGVDLGLGGTTFYHSLSTITGWWFGTWILFFHILGIIIPIDFHIFQRGRYTTNQIKTNYAEQDFPIFMAPFLSQSTCSYTLQDLFFPTCFLVFHYLHTCLQEFIVQCSFPLVSSFLDILGRFFLISSNVFFPMCFIKFHTFFSLCFIKFHTCFLVWLG